MSLVACAATRTGSSPEEKKDNPAGLSKTLHPEAQIAFSKARLLWKRPRVSGLELCTDPEQAIALLDTALRLEPRYPEALTRRALAKSELGAREEAFDDLSAAVRLDPSPDNYAYRALVSLRAKDLPAAQKDLDYSLQKSPGQHLARNIHALLNLALDDKKQACDNFAKGCAAGDCSFLEAARAEKICL